MSVLENNMQMLEVTGFWIDRSKPKNLVFYIKQALVHNIALFAFYGLTYGLPMYMYNHSDDLSEVSECLGNAVGSTLPITIYLTFVLKNEELTQLVQLLRNVDEQYRPSDRQTEAIDGHTKRWCRFWSVSIPRAGFVVFALLSIGSAVDVLKERDIERRLKFIYPFDANQAGAFELVVFAFACNFFYATFMTIGCNLMILCMFLNVVGHLRMLNHKFGSIRSSAEATVGDRREVSAKTPVGQRRDGREDCTVTKDSLLEIDEVEDQESLEHSKICQDREMMEADAAYDNLKETEIKLKMQELLKDCIAHHCELLKFIRAFEDYWNAFFGVNVAVCLMQSVLILTSSAMKSGNANLLVHFGIIATFYSMLGIFCYLSQQVTVESELLQESIYGCGWTDASRSFRRSVGIMVSVANQPIVITAGGFIPLSMDTFNNVLNSAYSYYMVLSSF